ncbi:PREDICTED: sec-independent protein translocase protein TATC, chloroplastic [Nicotiana attenuata]|uniref:Sec-independent protein translocase protein tatc, chloroplastic n=1 Tax=Nicotiana attenuata TaxID=49451 RepID=A0A1J6JBM1_NICAT|nr:PREDICTED: sec-independent protein translocase protein TATC, chloroplastic [Nicotiana attenuata]OIT07103.1 sec-independent protein translocase protein tatc, chloroplastic [Nicotiana attenuata]
MGSSSALISNLHLTQTHCFKCINSRTSLNINPKRPKLNLSSRKHLKKFNRLVCSAVEDAKEKQREINGANASNLGSAVEDRPDVADGSSKSVFKNGESDSEGSIIYDFLYPSKELLPDDKEMTLFDHLEELRQRLFVSVLAVGAAIVGCFAFSKELILILEAPVLAQGVRFLQLGPGEFFFTTLKVSGYSGLLLGAPVILYEIIAFVLPGLTMSERRFLAPIVLGSSVLFYAGIVFSHLVLTPAALNFFVNYAEGAVESFWSIDQYFEFVLVLMFSTGLSFQVPVIQLLLGQTGLVSGDQMLSIWRYVVVGAVVAAAVLTPSTDPLTQMLLAGPLLGLYLGGAWMVKLSGR